MKKIFSIIGVLLFIGCLFSCIDPYYDNKPNTRIDYYIDTIQGNVIISCVSTYGGSSSISSIKVDSVK